MSTATYTQANRPISVKTPLGKDDLLLVGFSGHEAISRLYSFSLDLLAENKTQVAFDKLLGQKISVRLELSPGKYRYFAGICSRFSQGGRDKEFSSYRLEVVPQLWLLTHRAQSRTFHQQSAPDILKKALADLNPNLKSIQGTYQKRDYCVQYRETDFNFVSRLMEEEGIYYFFKQPTDENGSEQLMLADTSDGHPAMPGKSSFSFSDLHAHHPGMDDRITHWEKSQELGSGKYALRDYCFESPDNNFEAKETIAPSVKAGTVAHKLKLAGNDAKLELFDFPGEFAQRFDGVDSGGGEQPSEISKISQDNQRTAKIRMQEVAASALAIHGAGACRHFVSGHKFTLDEHFNANGNYVATGVHHSAHLANFRGGHGGSFQYHNTFTCIPLEAQLPYRPPRVTPKPVVHGTQTAVVVGQPGEEIFTDKYGRVKVQFRWDREGKNDANSSCWVRVGSVWAGQQWGGIHIPRVGQEVVVAFEEGDPDQPIIVGSVYNANQMPPYTLPDNKTQSGLKTRSTMQGGTDNFNELRFEDKKSSEQIYFHAEKNFDRVVENNDTLKVGSSKADDGSQTIDIYNDRTETVETGNELVTIKKGTRTINVNTGDDTHNVKQGNRTVNVDQGNDTHNIKQGNRAVVISMGNDSLAIKMGNQTTKLDLGASSTEAMQSITLKVGQSSITIDQMGVTIKGMMVTVEGQMQTQVKGLMTQIQGSAMTQISGGITMIG